MTTVEMISRSCMLIVVLFVLDCRADMKFEKELKVAMNTEDVKASPYYKDRMLSIPISEEAGEELWQHWTDQAFSGLISAVATRRLNLVEQYDKKKHEKCSSNAHDITSHAKCLVALESDGLSNRLLKRRKYFDQKTRRKISRKKLQKTFKKSRIAHDWIGPFRTVRRAKRSIRQAENYSLKSTYDRSPFSTITKHLTNTVKAFKKKEKLTKWQDIIERIQERSEQMKKRKQIENLQRKRVRVFQEAKRISSSQDSLELRKRRKHRDGSLLSFANIDKYIEDEELKEMYHQKVSNMTEADKMMMVPVDLIRQAAKIGLGLAGQNSTEMDKKTLKLISPRFMSVLPEDEEAKKDKIDVLSPSLFSLHNGGNDIEKKTSMKSLLGAGMTSSDSQSFLDLLVEATGVAEAVEDAEQKLVEAQRLKDDAMGRGPDGQPLYFTKENVTEKFPSEAKKIELFEKLDKTYSNEQLKDMNQTGYTVLSPKQMKMMYGKDSPFENPRLLKIYNNMSISEIHRSIHTTIKGVADEKLKFEVRRKDIVLSPIFATPIINNPVLTSQPLILSPALFVPLIQSPAVFGAVILSPWVFVPVILSPRLLSPVVLTPFLFAPIVLSPLALVPVILAPGIFNPFILSPLVLCPFVLSPQVMTPLILSPFALTPLILTPLALSPIVLSPFVLSPQVMSPQFVTGIILSPYALSPAIESNEIRGESKFEKELKVTLDTKDIKASPFYKDKVLSLPISKEAGTELWERWTHQAFSGLISAIATRRLKLVDDYDRKKHEKCSSKAHDITTHAKCLVDLEGDGTRNRLLMRKKIIDKKKRTSRVKTISKVRRRSEKLEVLKSMQAYEAFKAEKSRGSYAQRDSRTTKVTRSGLNERGWVGSFKTIRSKRSIKVHNAASYELKSHHDRSPFAIITKHLSNTVKIFKKKEKLSKWQDIVERIQEKSNQMKKRKQAEFLYRKRVRVFQDGRRLKSTKDVSLERKKRKKHLDGNLRSFANLEKDIEDEELKEMYHQKMSNMTEEDKMMMVPVDLIRQAAKIGLGLAGHNTTDMESKNLKLISPRFMSVLPEDQKEDQNKTVELLSPSLFSLHNSGKGIEKKTSLKSLLGSGLTSGDSQSFLDLLVEATGVAEAVEDAEQKLVEAQRLKDDAMGRGPEGQPLYFTKENITERFPSEARKIEIFEKLDKTYSVEQLKDMNQTGYTVLSPDQMKMMYGKDSPFENPRLLKTYNNMTMAQIHRAIHNTIKGVADQKLKFEVRQKDIVLSPVINTALINDPKTASQALVLSPAVMVALINSPAVFGSVILSPWLFVPLILSPRILSPVILDPFMFVPIILSPVVLDPVVLSPGIFNPFVLSPLVMCPFILSPQVMTPLILSPFALTPLILNPLALSPIILSPFVLSPQVLSPQYISGLFLSPYALSPAIESTGSLFTVFASPSWLS